MTKQRRLRAHAIAQSLFQPATLKAALRRMAFVQADPIRSPARAQDLILRHRVKDYRAGDLERLYPSLNLEEDILHYTYGFIRRDVWRLLHPRKTSGLTEFEKKILAAVCGAGETHPRELEAHFGRERMVNAWGGYSKATKHALEKLHYRGLLRVARRENGIRVYAAAIPFAAPMPQAERLRKLALVIANILAPAPEKSFQAALAPLLRRSFPDFGNSRKVLADMLRSGELRREMIDGIAYIWPAGKPPREEAPRKVRFLAPFDPLVWDRRRFEHLWRWSYRFEAYTPPKKRVRGYYAMPLLWGDDIIGWVNADATGNRLAVEPGFIGKCPKGNDFRREFAAETARLGTFLNLGF